MNVTASTAVCSAMAKLAARHAEGCAHSFCECTDNAELPSLDSFAGAALQAITIKSITSLYSAIVSWSKMDWFVVPDTMYGPAGHDSEHDVSLGAGAAA